jgi:hypothetical protein
MAFGDYRDFNNFFFEISVGDSTGSIPPIKLPHHISRLCEKVEISESLREGENSTITLTFIEGSREPADRTALTGTAGLYRLAPPGDNSSGNVDKAISGSLTNRTGIITDLRFSGKTGITFLTESEQKSGKKSSKLQKNVVGKKVTRKYVTEPARPVFIFQERNRVQVKWGYISPDGKLKNSRTLTLYIIALRSSFSENGSVTTTITCGPFGAFLNQVTPKRGKPVGNIQKTSEGSVIHIDIGTKEYLEKTFQKAGIKGFVSSKLINDKKDRHHRKVWVAGKGYKEYLSELAKEHNAIVDYVTDVETIFFVSKPDFFSKPIKGGNSELFTFNARGSILKSVEVDCDFGGLVGRTENGLDENGEDIKTTTEVPIELAVPQKIDGTDKKEKIIDTNPTSGRNPIASAKGLSDSLGDDATVGRVSMNPSKSDLKNFQEASEAKVADDSRLVNVSVTTLGYPQFIPGLVFIRGIGVRYSGAYEFYTVNHILDANGYITKATGMRQTLSAGGIKSEEKAGESKPEEVEIRLAEEYAIAKDAK